MCWKISRASRKSSSTTIPSTTAKRARLKLCAELKKLNFTWTCTSRVTTDYETLKAMKEAGCRLLIVGYESGDEQILRNIKKGATIDMAQRFTENCHKLGLIDPRRFHRRPAGRNSRNAAQHHRFRQEAGRRRPSRFRSRTPYPGTEFYDYAKKNDLVSISMADDEGHQLPQRRLSRHSG